MASKRRRKPEAVLPVLPAWALEPEIDPRLRDERGITPERASHSIDDATEWGRDERGRKTVRTMRDAPIERLLAKERLSTNQYRAAEKYKLHWYRGGLCAPLQSIDPNRVFATDTAAFSGMAKSEAQAFHRQQFRDAVQIIGVISAAILDTVVCYEQPLDQVGSMLGWHSKPRGIEATERLMQDALDRLCRHWGI